MKRILYCIRCKDSHKSSPFNGGKCNSMTSFVVSAEEKIPSWVSEFLPETWNLAKNDSLLESCSKNLESNSSENRLKMSLLGDKIFQIRHSIEFYLIAPILVNLRVYSFSKPFLLIKFLICNSRLKMHKPTFITKHNGQLPSNQWYSHVKFVVIHSFSIRR